MENIKFELIGKVPSKKNLWHPKRGGGIYADQSVNIFINSAYVEVKKQLGRWKMIEGSVALDVCFLMDDRQDLDNVLATIFDLLQNIGMIKDDRQIRRVHAWREKVKPKDSKTFVNLVVLEE
jgi:Holliday junction resolvase RusA-like endonuclease